MNPWILIVVAIGTSSALRLLPVYLVKSPLMNNQTFLQFLDYVACAAIGCMIYLTGFSGLKWSIYAIPDLKLAAINASILVFTFVLSLYLRKPIKTFIISISLYAFILLLGT